MRRPACNPRARNCCRPKPRWSALKATAAAPLSWPRREWLPIRIAFRPKPTWRRRRPLVQSLKDQVSAAEADLNTAIANTHQAHAAQSTVESTHAQVANAEDMLKQAEVRLGYTKIYAPVTGTVSVRAAREGEVLNLGQPIVTIVDLSDTWVRAAIPETEADHIGLGDTSARSPSRRARSPQGKSSSSPPKPTSPRSATSAAASATSAPSCSKCGSTIPKAPTFPA